MVSLEFFKISFLTIIFYIYFKYIVGAVEDKKKFDILRKIGVGEEFIKKSVIKQTAVFFSIPYILGVMSGIVAGESIEKVFSIESSIPISNQYTLIAIFIFTIIYIIYFLCSVRKYLQEIK